MRSTKKSPTHISIIIPVFNEEIRSHNIYQVYDFVKKRRTIKEIIAVNDGSTDTTLSQLRMIRKKTNIRIVSYKKNKGKGYAIKKGIEAATGTHILIMDVDLSTNLKATDIFIEKLKHARVIIGTRKSKEANLIQRQTLVREYMGRVFTGLSRLCLGMSVSDFTCGFKLFETGLAKRISRNQRIYRWAYDNEYLYLAKKYGENIIEVPVQWKNDSKTKVRFPHDIFVSLRDLLLIRLHDLIGHYAVI